MSPLTIGILAAIAMVLAKVLFLRWLMDKADSTARPAPPDTDAANPPQPSTRG